MTDPIDPGFYDRADSFIHVANEHCSQIGRGKVSASFMYGMARFSAWVSACGFESAEQMREAKPETVEYFTQQFRAMLEENLEDYMGNFNEYMKRK
ncbi:DUF3144 domain-containing protein [Solimonas sp. K1W22B-7]|uniref:DUF3144 domain-containing protein n=1 Tax=Solimonas sp. K1W22B-7 TaxID=2303331 RepID=UPI000E33326D|nr:DUF3144 domain-containing protein [Solimonas sp. K1W22B-7]AXQ28172.1 DUF3144 domain-containing protein [Solimonas sp. K1W22B-7]